MLLVRQGEGVVHEGVEFVFSYFLIADMYPSVELGKVDIDPVTVFCLLVKEQGILKDPSIYGVFKGIGKTGLIEQLVFFFRQGYPEIAPGPGHVIAVAGCENKQGGCKKDPGCISHHSLSWL